MLPAPSDDNKAKKPVMNGVPGRSMLSGPETSIVSYIRTMTLIIVWLLFTPLTIVCTGMTLDARAGPEEPVAAGVPAGAPEGQPAPPVPASPREEKGTSATLQQEGEKQAAPSLSGQPLTGPTATAPSAPAGPSASESTDSGLVDTLHGGISRGFLTSATWLDSFFGDERYEAEINRSYLKVRFDAFREGSTGMDYRRPNFDLRLVLPQLRKKTRLVISGDPNDRDDATPAQPGGPGTNIAQTPERNLTTSLQYFPVETNRSNFSLRAGVKLHNGKLAVLAGPRYRYLVPLDPWALRFTQEFVWSTDQRWQSRTTFDFERTLPNDLFFRMTLEELWSENVIGYPYALSFLLRQPLDHNRAIQYEWVNSFQTHPTNELDEELLVFRFRQRFWRDWLFLEIAPQLRFSRDRAFEFTPGILFRLEMVFGNIQNIF